MKRYPVVVPNAFGSGVHALTGVEVDADGGLQRFVLGKQHQQLVLHVQTAILDQSLWGVRLCVVCRASQNTPGAPDLPFGCMR